MNWNSFEMRSQVRTKASADAVWSVLTGVDRWPKWSRVCVSSSVDEGFDWQVGERLRFRLRMAWVPVPFDVEIAEIEEGHRVAWHSTEFTISAVRTIAVESGPAGTVVSDHKAFHSSLLPIGIVYPRFLIRRMTESWLRDLRAEAEQRSGA